MSGHRPTLSLQILAGRAEGLADLLAHHRDLWDEAVVVDTGAGEAGAVAVAAGAEAARHPWNDDFAAARNTGLEAATADWILILDTDELIAPQDFATVRAALADPPSIRIMTTINYYGDPRHPEWRPVSGRYPAQEAGQTGCFLAGRAGLFPRRDDLRFRGCIHESIVADATRAGLPQATLDVAVHHYGYVLDPARNAARNRRDAALVRRKHAAAPQDPAACLELASVLLTEGRVADARALLERLAAHAPVDSAVTRGRFLLGRLLREGGDLDAAAALLARAVADDPRLLHCWLERIRVEAAREAWPRCHELLAEARARFGDDPLLDREDLRALIKTGRLAEAAATVDRLRSREPGWQDLAGLADRLRRLTGGGSREI
ncbi:MAG: tetratricopeptide repeat protein [Candidatus Krumholzibacteriia bacterium]